jgi:hypothetical protein
MSAPARLRSVATLLALGAPLLGASRARADGPPGLVTHPMHTAVAEIAYDAGPRAAAITIRVFADDFGAAVGAGQGSAAADSAMSRYVRGTFAIRDRAGRALPLRWVGAERAGDVILLRFRVPAPEGLGGARVASALLCERFEDQVNIVRVSYGGRSVTLLFTRGDASKAIP